MADENITQEPQDELLGEAGMKALKEERAARKRLEREIAKLKSIDLEEYETLKIQAEEREERDLEAQKQYEQAKAKQLEATQKAKQEAQQWKDRYSQKVLQASARKAFTKAGGYEDAFDLVFPSVSSHLELDGETVVVKDKDGAPIYRDNGEPATIDDLMVDMRENGMGRLFAPLNSSQGAGRNPDNGQPASTRKPSISASDRAAFRENLEAIAKGEVNIRQ